MNHHKHPEGRMRTYSAILLAICLLMSGASISRAIESGPIRYPTTPLGVPIGSSSDSLFGFVTSNMTITKSSPGPVWHVIGDLYVQPGVTLTIEPGVTLLFQSNADLLNSGNYYSKSEILVSGTLLANGAVDDSIRFQSTSGLASSWGQIRIEAGATASFNSCSLRDSDIALTILSPNFYGSGNHVSNSYIGIRIWASSCVVRRWTFDHISASGVHLAGVGAEIADCAFFGPTGTGVIVGNDVSTFPILRVHHSLFTGLAMGIQYDRISYADVSVNYCTFDGDGVGLFKTLGPTFIAPVRNTIVTNCQSGLSSISGIGWHMDYCDVWNASYGGAIADSGMVSINPLYIDPANRNYHLRSYSPLRVLGENGTQMGAYGAEGNVVGIPDDRNHPSLIAGPASPNPFSLTTTLTFTSGAPAAAVVTILDVSGRVVRSLMSQELGAGVHQVIWDGQTDIGTRVRSGVYYWRVASAGESAGGRLVYIR